MQIRHLTRRLSISAIVIPKYSSHERISSIRTCRETTPGINRQTIRVTSDDFAVFDVLTSSPPGADHPTRRRQRLASHAQGPLAAPSQASSQLAGRVQAIQTPTLLRAWLSCPAGRHRFLISNAIIHRIIIIEITTKANHVMYL